MLYQTAPFDVLPSQKQKLWISMKLLKPRVYSLLQNKPSLLALPHVWKGNSTTVVSQDWSASWLQVMSLNWEGCLFFWKGRKWKKWRMNLILCSWLIGDENYSRSNSPAPGQLGALCQYQRGCSNPPPAPSFPPQYNSVNHGKISSGVCNMSRTHARPSDGPVMFLCRLKTHRPFAASSSSPPGGTLLCFAQVIALFIRRTLPCLVSTHNTQTGREKPGTGASTAAAT